MFADTPVSSWLIKQMSIDTCHRRPLDVTVHCHPARKTESSTLVSWNMKWALWGQLLINTGIMSMIYSQSGLKPALVCLGFHGNVVKLALHLGLKMVFFTSVTSEFSQQKYSIGLHHGFNSINPRLIVNPGEYLVSMWSVQKNYSQGHNFIWPSRLYTGITFFFKKRYFLPLIH